MYIELEVDKGPNKNGVCGVDLAKGPPFEEVHIRTKRHTIRLSGAGGGGAGTLSLSIFLSFSPYSLYICIQSWVGDFFFTLSGTG